MTKIVPAAATALSLLLLPLLATAEPRQGHGNGRGVIVLGEGGGRFCPPGLAGRDPACVPPGQARQMISDEEREQRRAQRRAERRAERETAAEGETERTEAERAFTEAKEDGTEGFDAASILAALLTPTKDSLPTAPTGSAAQVTPVAETAAPSAQPGPVLLADALQRAAATGSIGY